MTAHGPHRVAARSADSPIRIWPGEPYPLGATWDGLGVNFAIFSEHATRVELCLFDCPDGDERERAHHAARADEHGLARLHAGCPAGPALRVSRPRPVRSRERPSVQPEQGGARPVRQGDRPARAVGSMRCSATRSATRRRTCRSTTATARRSRRWPRSSIRRSPGATTARRARRGTRRSSTRCTSAASRSCIRGCPSGLRGTYEALTTDSAISHLLKLGVTAVELMPVHHHSLRPAPGRARPDQLLGLQHARLLRARHPLCGRHRTPTDTVREFKRMVRALHAAGIEVILDVVYNHTAEGNHLGPTLSLRGIDNAPTTGCSRRTRATTWTSPAAATR